MKNLVIAFALIFMLAGGAVGTMKFLGIGPFAPDGGEEAASGGGADGDQPPENKGFLSKNSPVFYPLDPLVVPIFDDDKVVATIQIEVKLEVVGKENQEKVSRLRPRIADTLLRDLYGFLPRLIQTRNHVDITILKQRMQMMVDRSIGEGVVRSVLIQSVSDQAS